MGGSSAREFRVGLDEADLIACRAAGVNPEELVKRAAREAIAALVPLGDEGVPGEEEPAAEESEAATEDDEPDEEELEQE